MTLSNPVYWIIFLYLGLDMLAQHGLDPRVVKWGKTLLFVLWVLLLLYGVLR